MNVDEKVKEILSRSFQDYSNRRDDNCEDEKGYVAIKEEMIVINQKDQIACSKIDRTEQRIFHTDEVFVESFLDLKKQLIKVIYGLTEKKELVKVIYDTQLGFILAVDRSIFKQSVDAKEVAREFWKLVHH